MGSNESKMNPLKIYMWSLFGPIENKNNSLGLFSDISPVFRFFRVLNLYYISSKKKKKEKKNEN